MTLEKGYLLHNRYRIVEILGQGGMGSVYRAVDENLGVDVAVKENLFTTDEYSRQFRLEAVILANLRHTNLPRVSNHFVMGDAGQYLVMDFIEGEDLRQRMERLGTITEDDAIQIGAAMCDALEYLHTRRPSILHRDIKPGNVKITPEGHIYLVDFGLAKVVQGGQATTTGARAMTPGYSPPEQYGTARTDPRTDVYSLGATLYAALSGVIPEDGLARAMDNAQLTPLRKRNPKTSRRLTAAIEKAMAVDPSDRFQTAEEFKKALLGAKSKTQQLNGTYTVAPPPEGLDAQNGSGSKIAEAAPPTGPLNPPAPAEDDQPFVSPLKRQKERERKRQNTLWRFLFVLLVILAIGIPILAPAIVPADWRGAIPFFVPTATATSTPTASPLPTFTLTSTSTLTATLTPLPPTATKTLTQTPRPTLTGSLIAPLTGTPTPVFTSTPEVTATLESLPTSAGPTPIGGGYGQIAFAYIKGDFPQIYVMDINGGEPVQLTDMPEGACQPDWSPDGTKLVFISPCKRIEDQYSEASLFIINANGTGSQPLPTVPGGDFDPAWSPDGTRIAFTSLRGSKMEIYTIKLNDLSVTQLTSRALGETSRQPAWSPDGAQIVYTVQRLNVNQIWMMTAAGEAQKQIVRSGIAYTDYLPTWSRDGKFIFFNERTANTISLPYLKSIPTNGSTEQGTLVSLKVLPIENVEFSPDGFWLAFESDHKIYYMTVTGASQAEISAGKSAAFDPVWRPGSK